MEKERKLPMPDPRPRISLHHLGELANDIRRDREEAFYRDMTNAFNAFVEFVTVNPSFFSNMFRRKSMEEE